MAATPAPPAPPPPAAASAFDPAPWLDDLPALTVEMSSHYANLDHAVRGRRMNLAELKARIVARLRAATTPDQAKAAFRAFLRAFGDGHLTIDWPSGATAVAAEPAPSEPLCKRLGYATGDAGGVSFALAGDFTASADGDADLVPGGIVKSGDAPKLGVVRIGLFSSKQFPRLCEQAIAAVGLRADAACDDTCDERVERATDDLLTAALERRLTTLEHAGVAAVIVDITGNGGGTSWVEPVVRELSSVPIPSAAIGAVRHPHWLAQLRDQAAELKQSLADRGDVDGGVIAAALERIDAEIAEVAKPCDTSAVWHADAGLPACSQLVRIEPVLAYAKPGALAGRPDAAEIFGPSHYHYREGVVHVPVAVLVDGGTASAAEDLAEKLQDHHAAVIVGADTYGAGCGYTNGGIPTLLPRSGARVKMPDCARFRADGSNAVAGVHPDVLLPLLDRDSPYQRATKVAAWLRTSWRSVVQRR